MIWMPYDGHGRKWEAYKYLKCLVKSCYFFIFAKRNYIKHTLKGQI